MAPAIEPTPLTPEQRDAVIASVRGAVGRLSEAFAGLAQAAAAAAASIANTIRKTHAVLDPILLRDRRERFGGMRYEAQHYPDAWQSTVCAGLICSITECPSDEFDLRCTHSCHGGAA